MEISESITGMSQPNVNKLVPYSLVSNQFYHYLELAQLPDSPLSIYVLLLIHWYFREIGEAAET